MELAGKIVVVTVEWAGAAGLATGMAVKGATVVLVGPDGDAAGQLAAVLEASGAGRPAVFVTDGSPGSSDAVAEFVGELFRGP